MLRPNRIPLFPLDVVLLPAMALPLHIFEPRYRLMIARCLDEKIEFGMILAANNNIATVGCTAQIVRTIREYPDGRLDIATEGRAVFRLAELLDEKEYYEGLVEYVADAPSTLDSAKWTALVAEFEQCHQFLFGQSWLQGPSEDESTLAYRMAALLPVEIEKRQALLESRSEGERRDMVRGWIQALLPKLSDRERARKRAGGNGHALN
ncbi:MAG TPA: LON peptidase substrate-binding domain-containing protein [Candidatus Acidoferrales bacterium]|jgi:Lon protease-like protein|nr:LON peptidase substrate-binding domain-containing protein [Candidatus Acidoferrales bacterium]